MRSGAGVQLEQCRKVQRLLAIGASWCSLEERINCKQGIVAICYGVSMFSVSEWHFMDKIPLHQIDHRGSIVRLCFLFFLSVLLLKKHV